MKYKFLKIFTLIALTIFTLLGSWQVKRLLWKQDILNKIEDYLSYDPIEFNIYESNLQDILYKKVILRGKLHHDKEIHLYSGGKLAHGSDGYLIFTPFETQEGDFILVNRGWVPQDKKDPSKRINTLTMGITKIEGILINIREPRWKMFENNIEKNVWLSLDQEEISNYTELIMPPYYILQQGNWNTLPINTKFTAQVIRNDHFQYALTWYSLAAFSLAFLIILKIKKL